MVDCENNCTLCNACGSTSKLQFWLWFWWMWTVSMTSNSQWQWMHHFLNSCNVLCRFQAPGASPCQQHNVTPHTHWCFLPKRTFLIAPVQFVCLTLAVRHHILTWQRAHTSDACQMQAFCMHIWIAKCDAPGWSVLHSQSWVPFWSECPISSVTLRVGDPTPIIHGQWHC